MRVEFGHVRLKLMQKPQLTELNLQAKAVKAAIATWLAKSACTATNHKNVHCMQLRNNYVAVATISKERDQGKMEKRWGGGGGGEHIIFGYYDKRK